MPPARLTGKLFNPGAAFLVNAALPAFLTFLVYLPSLQNGFVNWDDPGYVYENPRIRAMDPGFFRWAFSSVVLANWHPLTMISYALDYSFWGLDPAGFHLTNVIFHCANTFLVFMVTGELTGRVRPGAGEDAFRGPGGNMAVALTAALLFGVHPLHVESVTWVSERKDVLSAFFFLLSILSYLRYAATAPSKRVFYFLSLVFFSLALLSKPMAISLPLVLLILDFCPLGRLTGKDRRKAVAEKVPFFVLSIVSAVLTIWAQQKAFMPAEMLPFEKRIFMALRAYIFYLYKMLIPTNLAPFYPITGKTGLFDFTTGVSFAAFTSVTVFCIMTVRRKKFFSALWLYYLITLAPVIGIVQVGSQAAADRYTYLPGLGPFILAGAAAGYFSGRVKSAYAKSAGYAVAAAVLALLMLLSIKQQQIWKDSVTLWTHQIRLYPGDYLAYNSRGLAYHEELKDPLRAIEDYEKAIEIEPRRAFAYNNRGLAYKEMGNYRAAIGDFKKAIRLSPLLPEPYRNLGDVYSDLGEAELALVNYKKAEELGKR